MTVTAKELRFNANMLFDVLSKGENITITYRGQKRATMIPCDEHTSTKDHSLFGIWQDKKDDVDEYVRNLRKRREF
jgi:antitoxin (DNA-binding transcriptional repressor) of toxin-antitoxin stability system